ncbi:UNVERIFIED_CONTAM: hypothetical protein FKN15_010049 [Acipenser sinensis]
MRVQHSQSRMSLSVSFEALAVYFPCMNSFDEEDGEAGGKKLRSTIQRSTETGLAVEMRNRMTRQASRESTDGSMNSYSSEGNLIFPGVRLASDSQFSDFLDGLGPAQLVGRQSLATPSMGALPNGQTNVSTYCDGGRQKKNTKGSFGAKTAVNKEKIYTHPKSFKKENRVFGIIPEELVLIGTVFYIRKYYFSKTFENTFITPRFIRFDKKQKADGKLYILPLTKKERKKYVTIPSPRLSVNEGKRMGMFLIPVLTHTEYLHAKILKKRSKKKLKPLKSRLIVFAKKLENNLEGENREM